MENVQECSEKTESIKTDEIIKPLQQPQQQQDTEEIEHLQQQQLDEPQQQQQHQQQQQQQQQEEATQQKEAPGEKSTEATPVTLNEGFEGEEEDDEDDDDDEEKETSQKLVIDIPDEEEEEEEKEDEDDEDDVIPMDEMPTEKNSPSKEDSNENKSSLAVDNEAIITLSDGEEDIPANELPSKPGKVQKRRSAGAGSKTGDDEDQFRLKRRKINVAGAPKMPLTGYLRYMNDRRESLRKEHPTKTSIERTKMIGEEWHSLPADVKASYLKAADADKIRYIKELNTFLKSRPDILASELAKNKARKTAENNSPNPTTTATTAAGTAAAKQPVLKEKSQTNDNVKTTKDTTSKEKLIKEMVAPVPSTSQQALENNNKILQEKNKRKRTPTPPSTYTNALNSNTTSATTVVQHTPGEIPIFTNEFLEHNKVYDMELRALRKSKTDLEQQNSVLEKHVENMKFGVEKMITENNELEEKNRLLEIYLDKLKRKLALALASLPLPSAPNGATVDNIDKYMQDLHKMSTSNSHGPATLNKAKDIIRKLDLQIQL